MKKRTLTLGVAALILSGSLYCEDLISGHKVHWDYAEHGPVQWGEFSEICAKGIHQSPVNIVTSKTRPMNHQYDLRLHEDVTSHAKIIDNGHSIKVTPAHGGNIELNGETFKLLQFHFHGKSEHTVDGKRYDMVAHLVHQNEKTKQLAVVAVFFKEGKAISILDDIINNMGKEAVLNPKDLLPQNDKEYYHYEGSLTTPPCSEKVQWYLLKTPKSASKEQIEKFRKYYTDNERPLQKLHDRIIESN